MKIQKFLFALLACVMLLTSLSLSVYAKNGPYPNDFENMTEEDLFSDDLQMSFVAVASYNEYEQITGMGYVYPKEAAAELPVKSKAISYDNKTNTLTLNGYKSNEMLILAGMGDDFKIKLAGYNELGSIMSSDMGWGGSITLTGNGSLVVNKYRIFQEAITLDFSGTQKGNFTVEKECGLSVYSCFSNELDDVYGITLSIYGLGNEGYENAVHLKGKTNIGKFYESITHSNTYYTEKMLYLIPFYNFENFDVTSCFQCYKENDDTIYFAYEKNDNGNRYDMYTAYYDEVFDEYVCVIIEDEKNLNSPEDLGYKRGNGSAVSVSWPSFLAEAPKEQNIAYYNDTKLAFIEYPGELNGYEFQADYYPVLEHPIYGAVVTDKNYLQYIVSQYNGANPYAAEAESVTYYSYFNFDEITVNASKFTKPAQVKLGKIENVPDGIKVSWSAVSDASQYRVYRKAGNAAKWAQVATVTGTSYTDKKVSNNTKYTYTVRAENVGGLGAYDKTGKSIIYITTPSVETANAANGIKVKWSKVSKATGYTVYRSQLVNGKWNGWKNMGTAKSTKSSWVDKSVTPGATYKYTVRAVSGKILSGYTEPTFVTVYLTQPTVKWANNSSGIKVSWSKVAGAERYTLYRSELKNGKWTAWSNKGAVKSDKTSWVDTKVKSGVTYRYTVRARSGYSTSAYQEKGSLLYLAQPTVKIANATNGIKVSWNKVGGAKGYTVYRSELKSGKWTSWKNMGTAKSTKSAWTDKSVKEGIQYKYTVRAVNGKVLSTYKATGGLVFLKTPNAKYVENANGVNVTWGKINKATSYRVYRSELVDGKWSGWNALGDVKTTSYLDKDACGGITYKYTVRAINGKSLSAYVSPKVTVTPTVKPGDLMIRTEHFTVIMPTSWNGKYVTEVNTVAEDKYTVRISEKYSKENGSGGHLLSYAVTPEYRENGSFYGNEVLVGTYENNGEKVYIYKYGPTDVQYLPSAPGNYVKMENTISEVEFTVNKPIA